MKTTILACYSALFATIGLALGVLSSDGRDRRVSAVKITFNRFSPQMAQIKADAGIPTTICVHLRHLRHLRPNA